jgi:hypothetical protein
MLIRDEHGRPFYEQPVSPPAALSHEHVLEPLACRAVPVKVEPLAVTVSDMPREPEAMPGRLVVHAAFAATDWQLTAK